MSISSKCYLFQVEDCTYSSWKLIESTYCAANQENESVRSNCLESEENNISSSIDPLKHRLFHEDVFHYDRTKFQLVHSPIRQASYLCGVLILEGNKTYGRTNNKKRLLYRVIPDQKQLPPFLVPYEIKNAFHKAYTNKYILFRFDHWTSTHPNGILTEVLGDVDQLHAFYEYQLYSTHLNGSIKEITTKVQNYTKKQSMNSYMDNVLQDARYEIEDRTHIENIFTVDSLHTLDFDDALHVSTTSFGTIVTVYLANVTLWMEYFHLWEVNSNRVATVYLPDRRRPMLPNVLSENFCSLQANQRRFAFAIDFHCDGTSGIISNTTFHLTVIRVAHNYVYDDATLLSDVTYQSLLHLSPSPMTSSHDLVAHWMVETNKTCANYLFEHKIGMFRTAKSSIDPLLPSILSSDIAIQHWIHCNGQYETYHDDLNHQNKVYAQVTSPIRRLVDLINQTWMISNMVKGLSDGARAFIDHWTQHLAYINVSMRSIRKVQTNCSLLQNCTLRPEIMEEIYEGIVFDKQAKTHGLFSYMVYLKQLKLLSRVITTTDVDNHSTHTFRIFMFTSEDQTKKKIRVMLIKGT